MPYMAESKILARQLQSGDVLVRDEQRVKVSSVEVKTKWVYVKHESETGSVIERISVDTSVVVLRPEKTPLEKQALELKYSIQSVQAMIDAAEGDVDKRRDELTVALTMHPRNHGSNYESYIEAQTIKEIWDTVLATAKHEEMNLRDATMTVRAEIVNELAEARHTSRSTSLMSNTVESVVLQAKADWIRALKYRVR